MKTEIGEKIRKFRKMRGMTQAELAGESITRNMLSLIENGGASPSLQTIEYLADRLGISPASFFIESFDDLNDHTKENNDNIKALFFDKEYRKCFDLIQKFYKNRTDEMSDELLLVSAEVSLRIGMQKVLKGAFESGAQYLSSAREYSSKCRYSTEWIDSQIFIYEAVIENSDCPMQSLDKDYFLKIRRCTGYEFYNYLYAVRLIDDNRGDEAAQFLKFNKIIEASHKEHINAKFMLLSDNTSLKKQALNTLSEMIKKAPVYPLDAVTRYLILKDIEFAARSLDNYEIAYKYASMRLKIISDMRD